MTNHPILNTELGDLESLSARVAKDILAAKLSRGSSHPIRKEGIVSLDPGAVWVVDSGSVVLQIMDKPVLSLKAGDVVGPWVFGLSPARLVGESVTAEVLSYPRNSLEALLQQNPELLKLWCSYTSVAGAAFFAAFAQLKAKSVPPLPQYRSFSRGDVIIKEGDFSREVLSLVEGGAEVFVHGEKVGEVKRDEIFGALAALTGSARGATVVASKPTVCMVFVRDDFEELLRSQSKMMTKLMEDIARALGDLNRQVADREKSSQWMSL